MNSARPKILTSLIFVAIIGVCLYLYAGFFATKKSTLEVDCAECTSIKVTAYDDDEEQLFTKKVSGSQLLDQVIQPEKIKIEYETTNDYRGGETMLTDVKLGEKITITPSYNDTRLKSLLSAELPAIRQTLLSLGKNIENYEIKSEKLLGRGQYYAAVLESKQLDIQTDDSLRVLLKKEGDTWVLISLPPEITLSKYQLKDVPPEIVRQANQL